MKISLNWLKTYLDMELPAEQVAEILTDIGLEVEGMEAWESIEGGLEGVVVGEVLSCERHPNADKLSLTKVDIGAGEPLQIVCGAPNVAAGQKVLVAQVGTTLHFHNGKALTLKKTKIRGEVSEGMICAEDELGLGEDHSGILVLPPETPVGTPASEVFPVERDTIFEIGLTPNRSDATCHRGVAQDLAAALKTHHGHSGMLRNPAPSTFQVESRDFPVEVIVENTEACPRYSGVSIAGVQVKESPEWLKNRLRAIGQRPINNIVDITNFILHDMGQPLHAFDLDKIAGRTVRVKTLPDGTPFTTLDEMERRLSAEDLMICDGSSKGMCIAGVFGGVGSGVTETTTNIFLESAHFNPRWIRRTSTRFNLRTDAARVFEKGSDPNITVEALKWAAALMVELGGGHIASDIVDVYPDPIQPARVKVAWEYVNRLIGVPMRKEEVREILEALNMKIVEQSGEYFVCEVPTNKADVTRPADVVEEILRIYGLNRVPIPSLIRSTPTPAPKPDPRKVRAAAAGLLTGQGFHEIMGLSLSQSRYYQNLLPDWEPELLFLMNTSNVHLDVLRPHLLFSGLEAIAHNQNRQQTDLKLFEFGKVYRKKGEKIDERERLALFLSGRPHPENWKYPNEEALDIYHLKGTVQALLQRLGLEDLQEAPLNAEPLFAYGLQWSSGKKPLATAGMVKPSILEWMDIRQPVFAADLDWEALLEFLKSRKTTFQPPSRFPAVRRDLAFVIEKSVEFREIVELVRRAAGRYLQDINLFDIFEDERKLGAGKKSYAIRLTFQAAERTLKDKEVNKALEGVMKALEEQLGAAIRR